MMVFRAAIASIVALSAALSAQAVEPVDAEMVTRKLWEATVTIRVGVASDTDPTKAVLASVTVSSGVSLGKGLVVTFSNAPAAARYRITLPRGDQAEAELRVVDFYSGLSLLEIDKPKNLPGLEPVETTPPVGSPVLTAAAAGIEKPVVSLGILGGVDRMLSGTGLPPLLQCDVRTTSTSGGAAVVDRHGRLVGIVAVTAAPGERDAWTYAVPVRHVQRLVRARVNKKLVILRRQRPSLGMTMAPTKQQDAVRVDRVVDKGPAAIAGIRKGDVVLEVDGLKVRNVYQAVSLILKKQPGDQVEFVVLRDGKETKLPVILGGRTVIEASQIVNSDLPFYIPQLHVGRKGNVIQFQRGRPHVGEVGALPERPRDDIGLLDAQVKGFAAYIEKLRANLQRRDAEDAKSRLLIESLRRQVEELRKQVDASNKAGK